MVFPLSLSWSAYLFIILNRNTARGDKMDVLKLCNLFHERRKETNTFRRPSIYSLPKGNEMKKKKIIL